MDNKSGGDGDDHGDNSSAETSIFLERKCQQQQQSRQQGMRAPPRQLLILTAFIVTVVVMVSTSYQAVDKKPNPEAIPTDSLRKYEENALMAGISKRVMPPVFNVRIPRIIHQTWNSTTDIPEKYKPWMRSWVDFHPGWQYVFWTRNETVTMLHTMYPRYNEIATNLTDAGMEELARYTILHSFGGVFVDVSMECKQPLDELHQVDDQYKDNKVYIGRQQLAVSVLLEKNGSSPPFLSNGIMASSPRHQFWLQVLETMKDKFDAGNTSTDLSPFIGQPLLNQVYSATLPNVKKAIKVLDASVFFPQMPFWRMEEMWAQCQVDTRAADSDEQKRDACSWLDKYPRGQFTEDTRALYHWPCAECDKQKQTQEGKQERKVKLWEVMKMPNGASAITFRPRFFQTAAGLDRVELEYNPLG